MPTGDKNPGIIVAEIRMVRQASDCSVLLVEGVDDTRFWESRRHSDCELVDGGGRQNVMRAVQRLDARRVGGVLGIVDEDYDCLTGLSLGSSNLLAVSPHDLECFLLSQTRALDRVLAEYGERNKIASFRGVFRVSCGSGDLRGGGACPPGLSWGHA